MASNGDATHQLFETEFRNTKDKAVFNYNTMNIDDVSQRIYMLRSNSGIDMLSVFSAARDSMRPCPNRADADRVDGPADGRKPSRPVSSGVPKQGDAGQAAESLLPSRGSRVADMNQAQAALYL